MLSIPQPLTSQGRPYPACRFYSPMKLKMWCAAISTTNQAIQVSQIQEKSEKGATTADDNAPDCTADAVSALASAKKVVIIPGYGMALAQAQFKVVELASLLEKRGADVKYAIHPVAGRMPGHMNVMLAEAEVDYDNLLEMDEVNPLFAETDVVMVFGACDVVNPAAIQSEGTPISGMPILMAHEAKKIIACNFDKKPGYSGVPNPLYDNSKTIMMLGDAKKSANDLISSLQSID
ncbi:MAG: NAD(P)(+) transhydrogenase (Re/Si-specific) subunit beta [Desulfosarcina sp.]|nr:NAD(P)(+) transhydrogenase (Re/Si-specific) subunit beta [Desulfosarcina sp.]